MLIFILSKIGKSYPYDGESDYLDEYDGFGSYNDDDNSDNEDKHDGCTGLIAKHNSCDIKKFPKDDIRSRSEFTNVREINFCCDNHAYVAIDECKVSIYQIKQSMQSRNL